MPQRELARLLATLACVSAVASHARLAQGASLGWSAPSQCPTEPEVIARIDASRGAPLDEGPPVVFSAEVTGQAGAPLTLTLRTQSVVDRANEVPTRTIAASDCEELVATLIELVALTLGPSNAKAAESMPTAPPPAPADERHAPPDQGTLDAPQPPDEEPSAAIAVLVTLDFSSLGVPTPGGRSEVAVRVASLFDVRASGAYYLSHTTVTPDGRRGARFGLAAGGVGVCGPQLAVQGCVGLEGGAVSSIGVGVTNPKAVMVPWLAVAPEIRVGIELSNQFRATLLLDGVVPLLRHEFLVDGQQVHAIPAFSTRIGLGLESGW